MCSHKYVFKICVEICVETNMFWSYVFRYVLGNYVLEICVQICVGNIYVLEVYSERVMFSRYVLATARYVLEICVDE